jgi:microcystin-dependent protein
MATIKSEFNLPDGNGGFDTHHVETELAQIIDIVRQPNTSYTSGKFVFCASANFPVGWFLECTTGGITGSGELTFSSAPSVGTTKSDGTVTWTVRKMASTSNIPTVTSDIPKGSIIAYGGSGTPSGFLLCDGSAVSRTTYSSLYSAIGTTWGSGNGSTTFNLPSLSGYWLKGSSTSGSSISAGLPNIGGSITRSDGPVIAGMHENTVANGALSISKTSFTTPSVTSTKKNAISNISFSAANYNSLYGASTTVSVSSKTVRYIIKY